MHTFVTNDATDMFTGEPVDRLNQDDVLPMPPSLTDNVDTDSKPASDAITRMTEEDERVIEENRKRLEATSSVDDYWAVSVPPVIENSMTDEPVYFRPIVDNSRVDPDDVLPLPMMQW